MHSHDPLLGNLFTLLTLNSASTHRIHSSIINQLHAVRVRNRDDGGYGDYLIGRVEERRDGGWERVRKRFGQGSGVGERRDDGIGELKRAVMSKSPVRKPLVENKCQVTMIRKSSISPPKKLLNNEKNESIKASEPMLSNPSSLSSNSDLFRNYDPSALHTFTFDLSSIEYNPERTIIYRSSQSSVPPILSPLNHVMALDGHLPIYGYYIYMNYEIFIDRDGNIEYRPFAMDKYGQDKKIIKNSVMVRTSYGALRYFYNVYATQASSGLIWLNQKGILSSMVCLDINKSNRAVRQLHGYLLPVVNHYTVPRADLFCVCEDPVTKQGPFNYIVYSIFGTTLTTTVLSSKTPDNPLQVTSTTSTPLPLPSSSQITSLSNSHPYLLISQSQPSPMIYIYNPVAPLLTHILTLPSSMSPIHYASVDVGTGL